MNSDDKTAMFAAMYGAGPKKIAAFVPMSDEMLEDGAAIHAYLQSKIHDMFLWEKFYEEYPDAEADAEKAYQEALGEV